MDDEPDLWSAARSAPTKAPAPNNAGRVVRQRGALHCNCNNCHVAAKKRKEAQEGACMQLGKQHWTTGGTSYVRAFLGRILRGSVWSHNCLASGSICSNSFAGGASKNLPPTSNLHDVGGTSEKAIAGMQMQKKRPASIGGGFVIIILRMAGKVNGSRGVTADIRRVQRKRRHSVMGRAGVLVLDGLEVGSLVLEQRSQGHHDSEQGRLALPRRPRQCRGPCRPHECQLVAKQDCCSCQF